MYSKSFKCNKYLFPILFYVLLSFIEIKAQQSKSNLPTVYPEIEILTNNNPSEEYLFLGLTADGFGHLMIVDNDAIPVFYKRIEGIIFNFLWQENGELTYNIYPDSSYGLDSSGNLANRFFTPDSFDFDFHELTVLEDGTYYVLGRENVIVDLSGIVPGGQTNATLITQNIYHMDTMDNEIWRWRSFDHYDILDTDSAVDLTSHTIDWTHCNSIKVDYDGNILLSTRNFNEITKINRQTGDIIWRFGGERNQFEFINDDRKFARQHDAKRNAVGNLILFDNGVRLVPQYSSFVEYELDEDSLTATLIRRFTKGDTLWSRIRGGVQGLSNGNHLICWGESDDPAVTEINSDNEIVYEISFPNGAHRYRSFRFPWKTNYFYTNKDSINFGEVSIGDSITVPITFSNKQHQQTVINEVFNEDSAFYINESLPIVIPSNDSVIISITFKPFSIESKNDKINFRYNSDSLLIAQQVYVEGSAVLTSAKDEESSLNSFIFYQNFPNPFNPITTIKYIIPVQSQVKVFIYNPIGEKIEELLDSIQMAGSHQVMWDAEDVPSGVYFYSVEAVPTTGTKPFKSVKKMIIIR
jgi:hypothetical protein